MMKYYGMASVCQGEAINMYVCNPNERFDWSIARVDVGKRVSDVIDCEDVMQEG